MNGYSYLLVIQDLYTKWIELKPLRRATGATISEALEDLVILRWGAPKVLLSDNGTEYLNKDIRVLTERVGFHHMTTPPYHPQADPVERVNRVLKTMITAFIGNNHREWDKNIPQFRFAHNSAFHSSIQATPAFLNMGREPEATVTLRRDLEGDPDVVQRPPQEWTERMRQLDSLRGSIVHALDSAFQKQAHYYNLRHQDREYQVGDMVWKKQFIFSQGDKFVSSKLSDRFHGPFRITKKISRVVYELSDLTGKIVGKFSVQHLKPYFIPD
ncbi:KRAB-A domain-containing protein 2-like [Cotesia glomerata]|uniref:KRAB-A domain-containing protein 2-like n=1 Tax=Cotesia glomerata TaxID=32391 RepID=UPI001D013896|nr:KRAB-A domain-containing protein 2-like [Cotesia glomerata]